MIDKGLIVSIQTYSPKTTQELAEKAIEGGAIAIRTDQPIKIDKPVIGLEKDFSSKYYITPTREAIIRLNGWSNFIAIDSRKGNPNLELLYAHCHINNIEIAADIEDEKDVESFLKLCQQQGIKKPSLICTTFDFKKSFIDKCVIIRNIKNFSDISIIAEGGYSKLVEIAAIYKMVNNICIGTAISDIKKLTKKYSEVINADNSTAEGS